MPISGIHIYIFCGCRIFKWVATTWLLNRVAGSQIAKFMGPTWGPPGSWRPHMGLMLAPWNLLSGMVSPVMTTGQQVPLRAVPLVIAIGIWYTYVTTVPKIMFRVWEIFETCHSIPMITSALDLKAHGDWLAILKLLKPLNNCQVELVHITYSDVICRRILLCISKIVLQDIDVMHKLFTNPTWSQVIYGN